MAKALSPHLDLFFSSSSITSLPATDLTDATGEPIFRISTTVAEGPAGSVSTLSHINDGGRTSVIVGKIDWRSLGRTVFEFRGEEMEVAEYLPRQGSISRTRSFTAASGRTYVWSPFKNCLQLTLGDVNGPQVARTYSRSMGFIGKRHPAYLAIHEAGFIDLEEIILTFIYVRRMEERRRDSQASAGSLV